MQEDIHWQGPDTRPPMLDRTDFESWQQRIRLYCLGKDNGENIMKSLEKDPFFRMGTVSNVITGGTEGVVQQGPGIPKDIYSLINHYTDAKDIWENVKMILEGSELTKDDRESQLYDEFEHFCQIKGETIQGYYQTEVHANENRIMMERFSQPNNDPLALVSDASVQQYPTQSSKSPQSSTEPYPSDNFQMDSGNGKVVVQDVRGRYNANNQGRPFQRNNARGNGVADMEQVTNVIEDVDDSHENDLAHNEDKFQLQPRWDIRPGNISSGIFLSLILSCVFYPFVESDLLPWSRAFG
ncbi:hypothetical protein Tco_0193852 [Tanacetum coccineum]